LLIPRDLAFGDIHGCLAQFDALLESIAPTVEDRIILLGDCVDRGPDSAGVINRILQLDQTHRITAIMGNHEQMMLAARESCERLSDWLKCGGHATLNSYAGAKARLDDVPDAHWQFLTERLVPYLETDTHIFIHASLYPELAMDEQPDYMLRWEFCDNIAAHESGKIIVCGHTPQKSGQPLNRGFAICIDTHAYGGGPLSCLDVRSGRLWQAFADGGVRQSHISEFADDESL